MKCVFQKDSPWCSFGLNDAFGTTKSLNRNDHPENSSHWISNIFTRGSLRQLGLPLHLGPSQTYLCDQSQTWMSNGIFENLLKENSEIISIIFYLIWVYRLNNFEVLCWWSLLFAILLRILSTIPNNANNYSQNNRDWNETSFKSLKIYYQL